jgi:hypothetical protein
MSDTPIWNVRTSVVELIAAPTAAEAQDMLSDRLIAAGFTKYEDDQPGDVFESEPLGPDEEAAVREESARLKRR